MPLSNALIESAERSNRRARKVWSGERPAPSHRSPGRPKVYDDNLRAQIRAGRDEGATLRQLYEQFGVPINSVKLIVCR